MLQVFTMIPSAISAAPSHGETPFKCTGSACGLACNACRG
jgi:hypothetical protein